jgi:hypothetical protein
MVLEGPSINTLQKTEASYQDSLISNGFDDFFEAINAGTEFASPEEKSTARTEALERELSFIQKVTDAADEMAKRHDGSIVMLFDVDESLRHVDPEGTASNMVRPAFLVAANGIREQLGDRLEIGLLTTRPQASLNQELSDPKVLSGVEDMINPTLLISSRDAELNSPWLQYLQKCEDAGDTEALLGAVRSVIAPEFTEQAKNGEVNSTYWFDLKLAIVDHLVEAYPDKAFVVIDDRPFVEAIDPDSSRVIGVSVASEIQDDFRREAALSVQVRQSDLPRIPVPV